MAKYQVPQFLEVEDKIFGPFTLKQFLYAAAGLAMAFIFWTTMPRVLAIAVGLPIVLLFFGLAFYQINNRPLAFFIETGLRFLFSPKLYYGRNVTSLQRSVQQRYYTTQHRVFPRSPTASSRIYRGDSTFMRHLKHSGTLGK